MTQKALTAALLLAVATAVSACDEELTRPGGSGEPFERVEPLQFASMLVMPGFEAVESCSEIRGLGGFQAPTPILSVMALSAPGTPDQATDTHGNPLTPGGASVTSVIDGILPPFDISDGVRPTFAFGVNEAETFVGYRAVSGLPQAAMRPAGATGWTLLSLSPTPYQSVVYDVNEMEQIVGTRYTAASIGRGFIHWNGNEIELPVPAGWQSTAAFDINDYGQAVGFASRSTSTPPYLEAAALLWTPTSPNGTTFTVTFLTTSSGPIVRAFGLNSRGDVVGDVVDYQAIGARLQGGSGAFVWTASAPNATTGTFQNIGVPPNTFWAEGRDINDLGEVVGNATHFTQQAPVNAPPRDVNLAFHWTQSGGFTVIPPPAGGRADGGLSSHAFAINNSGTVVGRAATEFRFFEQRMYLWHKADGVMELYAKLGGTCSSAGFGINECGIVAGWSLDVNAPPGSNTYASKWGTCGVGVTKTAPQATVMAGQTAEFRIAVENQSTRSVQNVGMTDVLPSGPGIQWYLADNSTDCTISGGAQQTVACLFPEIGRAGAFKVVTVQSQTTEESCMAYDNTATAAASGRTSGSGSATLTVQCPPHLNMSKSVAEPSDLGGAPLGFTVEVSNTGRGSAESVTLKDTLAAGADLSWQIAQQPGEACVISGSVLTCSFGTLAQHDMRRVTVVSPTVASVCSEYPNTAWIAASNHDTISASATASVGCAEIDMTKTAVSATVTPGDPVSFTITVNSTGVAPAQGVTITDEMPVGLGLEWTLEDAPGGACVVTGTLPQTLTCDFGSVPAGESRSVTVGSETANPTCGAYSNTATANGDGVAPVSATATVDVPCQPPQNEGVCEGGVTKMVLKQIGTGPLGGTVEGGRVAPGRGPVQAAQTMGLGAYTLYTFAVQPLGGTFDAIANGRIANEFAVYVGGAEVDRVHMSCSVPIYVGMEVGGVFEVAELSFVGGGGDGNDGKGKGKDKDKDNGNGKDKGKGKGKGGGGAPLP